MFGTKRRRNHYKFTEKTHSKKGIGAMILAILLVAGYIGVIGLSFKSGGALSAYFGTVGVSALILAVAAFVMAIQSLLEEDSFKSFPRAALGLSVLAIICWGGTYVIGFLG
ncbi:MAG: hypothetical protein J6B26_03935 [Agathobacter sp.]|nr:hypothetical protein [Agathobacter sp.]MBQ2283475.1 hypothetical protein [Agathobacter sp.]